MGVRMMILVGMALLSLAWGAWRVGRGLRSLKTRDAELRRREERLASLSERLAAASSRAVEEMERRRRELAELLSLCDERLAEMRRTSAGRKVIRLDQAAGRHAQPTFTDLPVSQVQPRRAAAGTARAPAAAAGAVRTAAAAGAARTVAAAAGTFAAGVAAPIAPGTAAGLVAPAGSGHLPAQGVLARHRAIVGLAEQGLDVGEIARRMSASRSEVQLVLALRDADRELEAATPRNRREGGLR
jgi:hypothetical protein